MVKNNWQRTYNIHDKKKIAWITDSTAYISEELLEHPDVYIVPLLITFGEESFEDGIDLNTDQLYSRIRTGKEVPKTSQPSAGRFAELFETLKIEYDAAVAVHVSSKLSGTMNSCLAGSELAGFPVSAVDSKCMSYAITSLIYKGFKLAENEMPVHKIAEILQSEADKSENYILLGSLEQFYKGGRMSGTQYLLGSILKIKPIIRINRDGAFELFDKVRSDKKQLKNDRIARGCLRKPHHSSGSNHAWECAGQSGGTGRGNQITLSPPRYYHW